MNKLKNKARDINTMLGGVELVAKALRVNDKTTTMRVNEVIIIKMDGAIDNTVIIIITLNIRAVAEPVAGESPIFRLMLCAKAESTMKKRPINNIMPHKLILFFMLLTFVLFNVFFNNLS